jgi:predicted ATPase/DNA-binding SARP family transcriptional activator/DNA-binding CsgD family transcriptional regulator
MPTGKRTYVETMTLRGASLQPLRVRLLDGFGVSVGSRSIAQDAWRLKKSAALVKLLALAPGHRMHREQVMDLLWPDSGRRSASNNLRSVLYAARKVLDPNIGSLYLASEGKSLALCPEVELWVDVNAFEAALTTARRTREPAAYRAALGLYAGELLPDDRYEDWAENRRWELRRAFLSAQIELSGLYEERGEYERGLEALQQFLAEEPADEEAHVRLMRLYAYSGRRQEALSRFQQFSRILAGQFGTEPGAAARRLRDEIAAGEFPSRPPSLAGVPRKDVPERGGHNLPEPRTSLVGRGREILEVKRALSTTRLLTLTGTGGAGKTRLALEVARDLVGVYPDGIWLIELAPLSDPGLVVQEVARTLGLEEQPGRLLLDSLLHALADKEMLVLLDNCEHLTGAVARLSVAILDSSPGTRVLATSRERLGAEGESTWPVPSLSVPRETFTMEDLEGYESVNLFVDRACRAQPGFRLTPENARAVVEVCVGLEGIPLAIELAAARIGMLSAGQISERLGHSLDLLTRGARTADRRHRTLRATLDWSYGLLGGPQQRLFGRLSAFAGGFTLEAAESVGGGGGVGEKQVVELLTTLVEKSLVMAEESWERGARFRLLETVRQYASEKLVESGEEDDIRRRHARFFLALAEEAEPGLRGPRQVEWLDHLEQEHDNLRAALAWSLEGELGARLAGTLSLFWYTRGYLSEGRSYLEAVVRDHSMPETARARALDGLGWIAEPQGDYERARLAYEESLGLYRRAGDRRGVANALGDLGSLALDRGDYERATSLLEESLALYRELGESEGLIGILDSLGVLASARGDSERSAVYFREALALSRGKGNVRRTAVSLGNFGITTLVHGDPEQATALLEESLGLFREIGDSQNIAIGLVHAALAALAGGDQGRARVLVEEGLGLLRKAGDRQHFADCLEIMAGSAGAGGLARKAARLWGAAGALREEIGVPLQPENRTVLAPYLVAARSDLGEAAWQTALAEGRAMSPDRAIEYSLSVDEPASPSRRPVGDTGVLSAREEEVAALVSQGLTNRQIASELSISEHTVATHITRILKRLGLNSRSRLSAWATERGLTSPMEGDPWRF